MGKDDLGVFARFEWHKANASGKFVEDVFLDDAADELVHLLRAALDFYRGTLACRFALQAISRTWCALDNELHRSHVLGNLFFYPWTDRWLP